MPTPAGVYVRISRDTEGSGLGVKRQREDCVALVKRRGWVVADVYEDNDVSASKGKPRREYERMMKDVATGRIRAVVVWDVDRLTRSPRELEDVIEHADSVGLSLASVGGDIDLGTVQGRGMARMKGVFARMEVEQASRRLKRKHAELAASGKHVGPRPFGWTFRGDGNERTLVIDHAEAAVLCECVDRVLDGEGLWSICKDLNARGVVTASGGRWQTQPLRRMLLRWRNCGVRSLGGKEAGKGEWDAIIDRDTHERVIATLTDPRRKTNNRGTARRYLLTGLVRCGACGGAMVGTNEFRYVVTVKRAAGAVERERVYPHSYKCPHAGCHGVTVPMAEVDRYVSGVVVGVMARDGVRFMDGDPAVASQAHERIDALEAKLSLIADQCADDLITPEQMARITAKVRPQLDAERVRLARAVPENSLRSFVGPTAAEAWEAADIETKRRVIDVLDARIVVSPIGPGKGARFDPERVRIEWRHHGLSKEGCEQ